CSAMTPKCRWGLRSSSLVRARLPYLCAAVLAAAASLACPSAPKRVVYDLSRRTGVAERWSSREVLLFGTPAAEPHQAQGFYREAGGGEGDSFLWAGVEAEISLTWPQPAPRVAVLDVAPYGKGQSAAVLLNGKEVARLALNDLRYRYRLA